MDKLQKEFFQRYNAIMAPTTIDQKLGIVVTKDEGLYLWDLDGKRYTDWDSSVAMLPLGHKHPTLIEGLFQTLTHGVHSCEATARPPCFSITVQGKEYEISPTVLGEMLKKHIFPNEDAQAFFNVSGSLAVDDAEMFALTQRPERKRAFSFHGAFHGRHGFARDFTCSKKEQRRYYPSSGIITDHLPFPRTEEEVRMIETYLRRIPLEDVNLVILEAVQGEGGMRVWNKKYWKRLEPVFRSAGIFIVSDEIQCGLGRTGKMWGYQHLDLDPDIVIVGKGLGGGLPMSAVIWKKSIETRPLQTGWNSGTFPGYPLGLTAAILTLHVIEHDHMCERAKTTGEYMEMRLESALPRDEFESLCTRKGLGLMQGIEFTNGFGEYTPVIWRDTVLMELKKHGILTLGCGHPELNPTIRFLPPLTIEKKDIDELVEALYTILPS